LAENNPRKEPTAGVPLFAARAAFFRGASGTFVTVLRQSGEGILRNNTPEAVKEPLLRAKAYADAHKEQPPLIVSNSWNEWTESSYLQPDDLRGYGYLEAVREVFAKP
jgi:hypothetical protein